MIQRANQHTPNPHHHPGTAPIRTPEEAEPIAAANMGLIYGAVDAHPHLWPEGDRDEAIGHASIAYWRACLAWDPDKGTLGTLVYRAVFNHLTMVCRTAERAKRTPPGAVLPIDERRDGRADDTAGEHRHDEDPWWFGLLTEEDRLVVRLLAAGSMQKSAAAALGKSHAHIWQILREIRAALAEAGVSPEHVPDAPRRLTPIRRRRPARQEVPA